MRLSFMPDGLYSPKCLEEEFRELRLLGSVLQSLHAGTAERACYALSAFYYPNGLGLFCHEMPQLRYRRFEAMAVV